MRPRERNSKDVERPASHSKRSRLARHVGRRRRQSGRVLKTARHFGTLKGQPWCRRNHSQFRPRRESRLTRNDFYDSIDLFQYPLASLFTCQPLLTLDNSLLFRSTTLLQTLPQSENMRSYLRTNSSLRSKASDCDDTGQDPTEFRVARRSSCERVGEEWSVVRGENVDGEVRMRFC